MNCTGCGARRGADVEFFLDNDAAPLADEALLREANDGPDWLCETCGGSNRFSAGFCKTCGAPRGTSTFRPVTVTHSNPSQVAGGTRGAARASGWTPRDTVIGLTAGLIALGAVAGLLLIIALLSLGGGGRSSQKAFGPSAQKASEPGADPRYSISRNLELTVDRVEWKRSVVVEVYREVVSEDWEDSVPADARVISQRQDVHHSDRVKVGSHVVQEHYTERVRAGSHAVTESYTDREYGGTERYECGTRNRGNGYFETVYCTRPVYRTVTKTRSKQVDDYQNVSRTRDKTVDDYKDVPVYRLKIRYSVKRWAPADTLEAQGTDLKPHWPKVVEGADSRAGQRVESYRVFLRDPQADKGYEREVSAEEFALFTPGAKCAATVNGFDQLVTLTPPPAGAPVNPADADGNRMKREGGSTKRPSGSRPPR